MGQTVSSLESNKSLNGKKGDTVGTTNTSIGLLVIYRGADYCRVVMIAQGVLQRSLTPGGARKNKGQNFSFLCLPFTNWA